MKSIKEIERMSLEELTDISSDESIAVPEGFMKRMDNHLQNQCVVEALTQEEASAHKPTRRIIRFISAAAAVAIIAGVGSILIENEPEDTFDDPRLAYAELEKAFATISDSIGKGMAMAEDSRDIIEKAKK